MYNGKCNTAKHFDLILVEDEYYNQETQTVLEFHTGIYITTKRKEILITSLISVKQFGH